MQNVFADNPIWQFGTCISPLGALNLRLRSAFTTLYSPASRKLVPGAETHMIIASCCTCTIVNREIKPRGVIQSAIEKELIASLGIVGKMTCEVDELNESKNAERSLYASVQEDG